MAAGSGRVLSHRPVAGGGSSAHKHEAHGAVEGDRSVGGRRNGAHVAPPAHLGGDEEALVQSPPEPQTPERRMDADHVHAGLVRTRLGEESEEEPHELSVARLEHEAGRGEVREEDMRQVGTRRRPAPPLVDDGEHALAVPRARVTGEHRHDTRRAGRGSARSRNHSGRMEKSMWQRSEQKRYRSPFSSALRSDCSSVSSRPQTGSHGSRSDPALIDGTSASHTTSWTRHSLATTPRVARRCSEPVCRTSGYAGRRSRHAHRPVTR